MTRKAYLKRIDRLISSLWRYRCATQSSNEKLEIEPVNFRVEMLQDVLIAEERGSNSYDGRSAFKNGSHR